MAFKLVVLRQISGVRCEAVVPNRTILKRKAKSSSPFQLSINIFGPRNAAEDVSGALSKVHAFLQHPQTLHDGVEYHNPDMVVFPGQNTTMNHLIGTSQLLSEEKKLSRDESFCRELSAHVSQITGAESPMQADGMGCGLGGLIADVMGVGKTLTMLTSILHSANKARDFSYFGRPVRGSETEALLTNSTLVVVPSVQLMENWESEIST
ncbi:hypothetical protein INS49_005531 [Diaporthe citri]|uniref:uncharacterized protein n=1 Tax=Diaporthe citri TaxID=83186 RepID=UPI001C813927|nr:uncharacterized protein INS49_005531 [Diaporthe citri]KAG6353569.1 hypothetical protein INS49_005531 [Diaporthe citri]